MFSYFISAAILVIGLSMVRIACPERQAGGLEIGLYRAFWAWFVLLTMIHINVIAAAFYGFLFPWIGRKTIDAFPWQWFGERQRKIGWVLTFAGAVAMLLAVMYTDW